MLSTFERISWKALAVWAGILKQRERHELSDLGRLLSPFTYPKARSALLKPSAYSPAHAELVGVKAPEQAHKNAPEFCSKPTCFIFLFMQ